MSFSRDVKEELSKLNNLSKKDEIYAEIEGYLLTINTNTIDNTIKFSTESEYNINRFHKLLTNLNIEYNIEYQGKVYVITFKKDDRFKFENKFSENEKKALVRGTFLGSGSINEPKNKYHLEVIFKDEFYAEKIQELLKEYNIQVKILIKKKGVSIYIKEGEEISKYLAFIGATKSVLKYEEIRVVKETRNNINRIVNCETANLNKTINASVAQIEAIHKLKENGKFDSLPDTLKEIANLRIENPDATLLELGTMLKNPIGKSGVNHRLKKLQELSE